MAQEVEEDDPAPKKGEPLYQHSKDPEDKEEDEMVKKHHIFPISVSTIFFHVTMMLSSMYYGMICSNWLNPGLYTAGKVQDESTYWLKTTCLWLSLLIFLFSLVAPKLFPNRQF